MVLRRHSRRIRRNLSRKSYLRSFYMGRRRHAFRFPVIPYIGRRVSRPRYGALFITYKLNNTFIGARDARHRLYLMTAGKAGYHGPKRSTPFAREMVARAVVIT